MQLREDTLNDLIGLLYAGVADESRMQGFLARLAQVANAHTGVIQIEDPHHARGQLALSVGAITMGSDELRAYNDRYGGENIWVQRGTHLLLRDGVITGADIVDPTELMKTAFYQDFLRPVDVHDSIGALLWDGEGSGVAMLTLNCSRRQGLFGAEQRALLQRLLPHLQNAYGLRRRLSWVDSERRSMRAALDHLRFGVLLIDAEGHLRVANTAAVKLLAGQLDPGTGIARLPGLDASSRKALHAAVAEVLNPVASRNLRTRIFLRAADATTGGLVAVIASLHAAAFADFDVNGARVAIFLHPVKANAPSDEGDQWLAQAYGLSPVQVRLTRLLCEGLDLEQCAIALNNRMPTVRTQLKAIYAKTGVRRQAELVAMLGGLLRT